MKFSLVFALALALFLDVSYLFAQPRLDWASPGQYGNSTFTTVFFTNASTGFIAGYNGAILKTTDAGQTWNLLTNPYSWDPYGTWYKDIYFPSESTGFLVGEQGVIVKTEDAGETWTMQESDVKVPLYSVFFIDEYTGYAGGASGTLLKTIDGGQHWNAVSFLNAGDGNVAFSAIEFMNASIGFAAGKKGNSGMIIKTVDGGQHWTELPKPSGYGVSVSNYSDVAILDDHTIFVVGSFTAPFYESGVPVGTVPYGMASSHDGGQTWTLVEASARLYPRELDFPTSRIGYTASRDLVLFTNDGGLTWQSQDMNPEPTNAIDFLAVHSPEPNRAYFVGTGVLRLTGPVVTDPSSLTFDQAGGPLPLSLRHLDAWQIESFPDWISVGELSGTGDKILAVTAEANLTGETRTGNINFFNGYSRSNVSISQPGVEPTLTVSTHEIVLRVVEFNTSVFDIESNATTKISASTDWISVTNETAFGNRTIAVQAEDNAMAFTRTGFITVTTGSKSVTIRVTQDAAQVTLSTGGTPVFAASGGSASFQVICNSDWTIKQRDDWFNVIPKSGRGNAMITLNTEHQNNSIHPLISVLDIQAGESIREVPVVQEGVPLTFATSPENFTLSANSSSEALSIQTNSEWELLDLPDWVTAEKLSGFGDAAVILDVAENVGANRVATIRIHIVNTDEYLVLVISQLRSYITPHSLELMVGGDSRTVEVTNGGAWTITNTSAWLSISPKSGTGNSQIAIKANPNNVSRARSSTLTLTFAGNRKETVKLTQPGVLLSVQEDMLIVSENGETRDIDVTSNIVWSATSSEEWAIVSVREINGTKSLSLTVAPLGSGMCERTGLVHLIAGDETRTVTVVQKRLTPPAPQITMIGKDKLCSGESTRLEGPTGYLNYHWSNGASDASILINTAGVYTLQISDDSGCRSAASIPVTIQVHPVPPSPREIELLSDGTLRVAGETSRYVWYFNGERQESTSSTLKPQKMGHYSARALSDNGCQSSESAHFDYTITALPETPGATGISIFPNPSNGEFSIMNLRPVGSVNLYVYDGAGKLVYQAVIETSKLSYACDLRSLGAGAFSLQIYKEMKYIFGGVIVINR